mmetsp:Transcript_11357/g.13423  ORF Transcript_11357/g.13423 Transcript_11357/m.13423 type:complete len:2088 (+) Transcript_11357:378-6641(+)|eukprot:CAMPEP_0197853752 /NCGR_PEP_ID=MMETSP1438-20131217/23314_1 /TAXON_ID=1461541 /ORGANISM="Pterosperma sp., Strain CCMP1384" /LENGTH=2087 /DNA_ID=CAMNT_0043468261 /DNA_START=376 /DNA_END=6639 /DNA_ORIENTATION=+
MSAKPDSTASIPAEPRDSGRGSDVREPGQKRSYTNKGKGGSRRRTVFAPKAREMSASRWAFLTELVAFKHTILLRAAPQVIIACLIGLMAQASKIAICGGNVEVTCDSDMFDPEDGKCKIAEECPVTLGPMGHNVVGVVLSFLLVFRTGMAYDRYYDGKAALGSIYSGIRDLNIAFTVFLRLPKEDEENYDTLHHGNLSVDEHNKLLSNLARDRVELLRLTNLLYAFIRQAVREHRHGYSDTGPVSDEELIAKDRAGKPSIVSLFKHQAEAAEYKKIDYFNRPNIVMAHIQSIAEHHRRMGHISERGALDIYHECCEVMQAFKVCERIVTTPIPYQYLHMLNFLLFWFVYTAPFVFSASFKYVTPFAAFVVGLAFYGVNEIGHCMEDPFDWEEPNHDLTAIGWRMYRENTMIHEKMDALEKEDNLSNLRERTRLSSALKAAPVSPVQDEAEDEDQAEDEDLESVKIPHAQELKSGRFAFLTEVVSVSNTTIPLIVPQLLLAVVAALLAVLIMKFGCEDNITSSSQCYYTFSPDGHTILGPVVGILLIFRSSIACDRYYEAKTSLGTLYNGIRNLNVAFATFMRVERPDEPGFKADAQAVEYRQKLSEDRLEVLRLSNLMYAFMRHSIREHRVGYPKERRRPTDKDILTIDKTGKPVAASLFHEGELDFYSAVSPNNRPNIVTAKMMVVVENHRRMGHISERGAFEIYFQCEDVLEKFKACERIVSTPIPYQYLHMLNFILFTYVYTAPLVFNFTFKWMAPVASLIVTLAFYGINEVGRVMQDPFDWDEPCHDLTAVGWRVFRENLQIHEKVESTEAVITGGEFHSGRLYKVLSQAMKNTDEGVAHHEESATSVRRNSLVGNENVDAVKMQEMERGNLQFVTEVFKLKNTVHVKIVPQLILACIMGIAAQGLKMAMCGPDVVQAYECAVTFSPTAHLIVGMVTGFLLVFRTNIAYYRFYEGKKALGQAYNAIRNINVAFVSFLRCDKEGEPHFDASFTKEFNDKISKDHVEMRRLSNIFYAFMRQSVREQRHGYPESDGPVQDKELVFGDRMGRPSLAQLLTDEEKEMYHRIDFNSRMNVVACKMQIMIESCRRLGYISERGAFDVYHDIELALDAFKTAERIVQTKMPYQYLHMVTFILFVYIYSVPFIFTADFKYATPLPCAIMTLGFYGIYEIGRAIEDPFSWEEPNHDLSGIGWRIFNENLQLHEVLAADSNRTFSQGGSDIMIMNGSPASAAGGGGGDAEKPGSKGPKKSRKSITSQRATLVKLELISTYKPPTEVDPNWYGFVTEVFKIRHTVITLILPQVFIGFCVGFIAQLMKIAICGDDTNTAADCNVTFTEYAHSTVGAVLGFLLVFRTNLAYDRFYEAKIATGVLHNGLRNLNIGVSVFLRAPREGEPGYNPNDKDFTLQIIRLAQDRVEILRLSALLMGFMRHALREQRIGYPGGRIVGDDQLLQEDLYGKPSIGALLTKGEVEEFKKVSFNNRPNITVTLIQRIVEHNRRVKNITDRGAFDIYHECEIVLEALKTCEQIVVTPVPFQYLHMVNFVLFFFVFSSPFVFSISFKWINFFPSAILALGFYGIEKIGQTIEHPFDWEEPNHNLTGLFWRIYRENIIIHRKSLSEEEEQVPAITRTLDELATTTPRVTISQDAIPENSAEQNIRRQSAIKEAMLVTLNTWPRGNWAFFTQVWIYKNTVFKKCLPQIICAGVMGLFAQAAKIALCGDDVVNEAQCSITFDSRVHSIAGGCLGFLLVFRTNLAYNKYYEGKQATGEIYTSFRNVSITVASFLRASLPGEPGYKEEASNRLSQAIYEDMLELRRQCSIAFAFIRQAIREQRHGYPDEAVGDEELLRNDKFGSPSLHSILTEEEIEAYLTIDYTNRANIAFANLERIVERHRRLGLIYEKSAYDIFHEMERVMSAYKCCEKIVTTPLPYQYLHMVNFLLFCYVFSAPFVFTATFKYLTPLPSMVLALGFYGIAEIGTTIEDPFNWSPPTHDMSAVGTRIHNEVLAIHCVQSGGRNQGKSGGGPVMESYSENSIQALSEAELGPQGIASASSAQAAAAAHAEEETATWQVGAAPEGMSLPGSIGV